jgi:hypothetical protein
MAEFAEAEDVACVGSPVRALLLAVDVGHRSTRKAGHVDELEGDPRADAGEQREASA